MVKTIAERLLELEAEQQSSDTEPAPAEELELPTLH